MRVSSAVSIILALVSLLPTVCFAAHVKPIQEEIEFWADKFKPQQEMIKQAVCTPGAVGFTMNNPVGGGNDVLAQWQTKRIMESISAYQNGEISFNEMWLVRVRAENPYSSVTNPEAAATQLILKFNELVRQTHPGTTLNCTNMTGDYKDGNTTLSFRNGLLYKFSQITDKSLQYDVYSNPQQIIVTITGSALQVVSLTLDRKHPRNSIINSAKLSISQESGLAALNMSSGADSKTGTTILMKALTEIYFADYADMDMESYASGLLLDDNFRTAVAGKLAVRLAQYKPVGKEKP